MGTEAVGNILPPPPQTYSTNASDLGGTVEAKLERPAEAPVLDLSSVRIQRNTSTDTGTAKVTWEGLSPGVLRTIFTAGSSSQPQVRIRVISRDETPNGLSQQLPTSPQDVRLRLPLLGKNFFLDAGARSYTDGVRPFGGLGGEIPIDSKTSLPWGVTLYQIPGGKPPVLELSGGFKFDKTLVLGSGVLQTGTTPIVQLDVNHDGKVVLKASSPVDEFRPTINLSGKVNKDWWVGVSYQNSSSNGHAFSINVMFNRSGPLQQPQRLSDFDRFMHEGI